MQIIIDISEDRYKDVKEAQKHHLLDSYAQAVASGTPIPDNATNIEMATIIYGKEVARDLLNNWEMSKNWWNAPYKAESEE